MADTRDVYAKFSVTSGGLCYGALHNMWGGASIPVQGFPNVRPRPWGTVISHSMDHNVPAENGTWIAFQLVNVETRAVCGWFVSHADVDQDQEIDKLLRVSGSPYDYDSGSSVNTDETRASGVLVINRYDWGYYDKRFSEEIREELGEEAQERETPGDGGYHVLANTNSAGIADYAQAKALVREWTGQVPSERVPSTGGLWMYLPQGEYMFGRFGFNDEHTAARSFLFFSASTGFTSTAFSGLQQTLRKEETHEERFERRLHDGHDFSGIALLHRLTAPPEDPRLVKMSPLAPPESECLGPYDQSQHLLLAHDFEAIRRHVPELTTKVREHLQTRNIDPVAYRSRIKSCTFVDPWKERLFDLLNELVMSYLQRLAIPYIHGPSPVAETLFPNYEDNKKLDHHLYPYFTQPHAKPIPGFDVDQAARRIKQFLGLHSGERPVALDDGCIAGLCRVVVFLVDDLLELATHAAIDNYRTGLVPYDVRISIYNDDGLYEILQYSTVLWKGRE